MKIVRTRTELQEFRSEAYRSETTVGLVPTMGFLHAGHGALIEAAGANDLVVVSLYVNPAQFGAGEDLDRYPRDFDRDVDFCAEHGAAALFAPSDQVMYPHGVDGQQVWVDPGGLADMLEGRSRPGHFRGVATVVAKLFNLVQPDRAYFGQKDAQQAVVIRALVRDLGYDVEIITVPTVRDEDGLALSSRNTYLSDDERIQALSLSRGLERARTAYRSGNRDPERLAAIVRAELAPVSHTVRIDYVELVDAENLGPPREDKPWLLAAAVFAGRTRLIDNIVLDPGD